MEAKVNRPGRELSRRDFLRLSALLAAAGLGSACSQSRKALIQVPANLSVARFAEKAELIMLTDRPPQLETPLFYFRQDFTPNEAFFVRWHLAGIPLKVDEETFRLKLGGHTERSIELSLSDLKNSFAPISVAALNQCSGNSRSFFSPQVPGGQWGHGAMGNAIWKGVPLQSLLKKIGLRAGAQCVSFAGLDEAPLASVPKFAKALPIETCLELPIMVAYEMNGEPLPMLNGYPLRLVVPGWYATYWVKALCEIRVWNEPFKNFWMDTAYRIPKNDRADESPEALSHDSEPISQMCVRSILVKPEADEEIKLSSLVGGVYEIEGLAMDGGTGIKAVELSLDGGRSWQSGILDKELGNYSWRRFRFPWRPTKPGLYDLRVRAINNAGQTQSNEQWNRSGYMRSQIEKVQVAVQ